MVTLQHKILEVDSLSKAGSWYPKEVVNKFVDSFDKTKPVYGLFENKAIKPNDRFDITPSEASHRLTNFVMDGKKLMAVIETTENANGKKLEHYLNKENGVTFRAALITDTVKIDLLHVSKGKHPVNRVSKMELFSITANAN